MSSTAATANPRPFDVIMDPPLDSKKDQGQVEEIERADDLKPWDADRDVPDMEKQPGMFGFLFKKNPSPEFIADLATMNETELDKKEVARLTRKIDLLILPALSVCYMVRSSSRQL